MALTLWAMMLWQAATPHAGGIVHTDADTAQFRYERALGLPNGASGEACAILDPTVFAHASNESLSDLRVVRQAGGKQQNIPFAVRLSEAQPTDGVAAIVQNAAWNNGDLAFDLLMPKRAYTTVDLQLALKNFVATAQVWGMNKSGNERKPLGTFVLFDLTSQALARSTTMALQESTFPRLHIVLHMHGIHGEAMKDVPVKALQGAVVPASREAQTLYTVVAAASNIVQQNKSSVVLLAAPAHVPVERVSFTLPPAYTGSFLRAVSVSAETDHGERLEEMVEGSIWRVLRKPSTGGVPAIAASNLSMDAVIASNMRQTAMLKIALSNGNLPAVPIQSVALEMRQRTVCFDAVAGSQYAIRYGSDAPGASIYDRGSLSKVQAVPLSATLGPEVKSARLNEGDASTNRKSRGSKRSPQTPWILLLAFIALLGALASRHTKRQGRHR